MPIFYLFSIFSGSVRFSILYDTAIMLIQER